MFEYLPEVCRELNANIKELYWILIIPFTLLIIILEFFKIPDRNPNVSDILKRVVISILLLISFDFVINTISMVGDGVTEKIQGITKLQDLITIENTPLLYNEFLNHWTQQKVENASFRARQNVILELTTFYVVIVSVSFIMTYYTFKSKSLWPAVIFHAVSNVYIQKILPELTIKNEGTEHWHGENGIMFAIVTCIFGIYFWRKAINEKL